MEMFCVNLKVKRIKHWKICFSPWSRSTRGRRTTPEMFFFLSRRFCFVGSRKLFHRICLGKRLRHWCRCCNGDLPDDNPAAGPTRLDDVATVDGLDAILLQDAEAFGRGLVFVDRVRLFDRRFTFRRLRRGRGWRASVWERRPSTGNCWVIVGIVVRLDVRRSGAAHRQSFGDFGFDGISEASFGRFRFWSSFQSRFDRAAVDRERFPFEGRRVFR